MKRLATLFLLSMAIAQVEAAPEGVPDASFNGTGELTLQFDSIAGRPARETVSVVLPDASGGYLAIGTAYSQPPDESSFRRDLVFRRIAPDGNVIDDAFATGDLYGYPIESDIVAGWQGERLVFAMETAGPSGQADVVVCAAGANGTSFLIDPTFGDGGCRRVAFDLGATSGTRDDYAAALLIDAAGRIYLAGVGENDSTGGSAVAARLTPSGTLDASFAGDGVVAFTFGRAKSVVTGAALDSKGRLVVSGATDGDTFAAAAARVLPDGTLDPSFGTGGVLAPIPVAGSTLDVAVDLAITDGDRPLLLVYGLQRGELIPKLVRLTSAGALDAAYAAGGVAGLTAFPRVAPARIVADGGGRFLLAGSGANTFVVWRVDANGQVDCTYGTANCRFGRVYGDESTMLRDMAVVGGRAAVVGDHDGGGQAVVLYQHAYFASSFE